MDRLDLGILKILLVNNGVPPGSPVLRKSFRSMAKDLGVDQGTIRKRMKRFQEQRVLKGWYLGLNPSLSGQNVVHAWLSVEPESEKDAVIERLLSVREVERVCNYMGPKLSLVLFCQKGKDQDDALIRRLAKVAGPHASLHKQGFVQTHDRGLKETDLVILGSLRQDPWKPYPTVAKEVGLSAKTVKRRIDRLSEDGAIYTLPIIDLRALQGVIPVELVVDYNSPESKATANEKIMSHIREELLFTDVGGPGGYFALIVSNVSRVEQIASWAKRQSGVKVVRTEVLQDVALNRNHYEEPSVVTKAELERGRSPGIPKAIR